MSHSSAKISKKATTLRKPICIHLVSLIRVYKSYMFNKLTSSTVAIITSSTTPTVHRCRVKDREAIVEGDYSRLQFAPGDGIVLKSSALALPEPWKQHLKTVEESPFGHLSLLGDLKTVDRALHALK